MVAIIESGSTKSDWVLIKEGTPRPKISTIGFNPFFHNPTFIAQNIQKHPQICEDAAAIQQVYFYGAGCSTNELRAVVKEGLQIVFTNAKVHVGHDLAACAYATYRGKPAIACILGTGSNSCYYDGKQITEEVPALSYILGDEGSGSYYGKILLSKFLYKQLPPHIHEDFYNQYQLDKTTILTNVYFKPNPNVYIASFMKFASRHKDDPFIIDMVREGMRKFMKTHVLCFDNYKAVETNFIGSIAHYFREILRQEAKALGIKVGTIVKNPVDGLVNYHLKFDSVQKTV